MVGDYNTTETVHLPFNTFTSDDPSASVTITDLVAGDIKIHADGAVADDTHNTQITFEEDACDPPAFAQLIRQSWCHFFNATLDDDHVIGAGFCSTFSQGVLHDSSVIDPVTEGEEGIGSHDRAFDLEACVFSLDRSNTRFHRNFRSDEKMALTCLRNSQLKQVNYT